MIYSHNSAVTVIFVRCIRAYPPVPSPRLRTGASLTRAPLALLCPRVCCDVIVQSYKPQTRSCPRSNDAFDAVTGVDTEDRKPESIINLTGLPWLVVLAAAFALLAWGVAKLFTTLTFASSPASMYLFAGSILCGYIYQGPPFRCPPSPRPLRAHRPYATPTTAAPQALQRTAMPCVAHSTHTCSHLRHRMPHACRTAPAGADASGAVEV